MARIGRVVIIVGLAAGGMIGGMPTAASAPPRGPGPSFAATVEPISAEMAAEMVGVSWHEGCPVPLGDLALISMPHWGFDGAVQRGELVVHAGVATDVVGVFAQLYADRFPIRQMVRIEAYGGDDEESMAANNSSAFNCRLIAGTDSVSVHSWGQAIDINTLQNPYVRDGVVQPPAGADYLDRENVRQGMIVAGDAVVAAFAAIGWEWGGDWRTLKDYQHFETAVRVVGGGNGEVPPRGQATACSVAAPDSSGWAGVPSNQADLDTGTIDIAPFNAFLATADPPLTVSPCDAARVFVHADRPTEEAQTLLTVVEPSSETATRVTITHDRLLDDSARAARYELDFEHAADGTIRLATASYSWRCRPGRGHDHFSTESCV